MNNNLGNRPPLIDAAPIPHELRERDLWLMWGNDDPDAPKRPHWRGNTGVSWPEPNDWRGFNDACTAAEERPAWGIGYIFAYDNDDHPRGLYGVLDLDGCLDANGRPKAWLPSLAPFLMQMRTSNAHRREPDCVSLLSVLNRRMRRMFH